MGNDRVIGSVTWFDGKKGYGFVRVKTPGLDKTNTDIFLHFSNIMVDDRDYKVVYPGEYIEFELSNSPDGRPCCLNVRGVFGGDLLTQNVDHKYKIYRKRSEDAPVADSQVADSQVADSQVADSQVADSQVADAGDPDDAN